MVHGHERHEEFNAACGGSRRTLAHRSGAHSEEEEPGQDSPRPLDVFSSHCPSRTALLNITGKWAPLVLLALDDGNERFGEICRAIGGSNERMVSQTLTTLTEDGLVTRDLDPRGRPRYALTVGGSAITARVRELRDAIYEHLMATGAGLG